MFGTVYVACLFVGCLEPLLIATIFSKILDLVLSTSSVELFDPNDINFMVGLITDDVNVE